MRQSRENFLISLFRTAKDTKKGVFISLGCYGGWQRYIIYFDIVPLEKFADIILMSRAWRSPCTFPSFLALFLALGTCPRHLRSKASPLSPRERHFQWAIGLLRAMGDIFQLELFWGGEKCRFGDSGIFLFSLVLVLPVFCMTQVKAASSHPR